MSSLVTLSFTLPAATFERLEALAHSMRRSREWILERAVQDFILYNEDVGKDVQIGQQACDNAEFADDGEIAALFAHYERD